MKKNNNKLNILSVKKEDRSSRFVIDLKKAAEEEEAAEDKAKKEIYSGDFLERLAEFDFEEFFEKGRGLKGDFKDFFDSCREDKRNIIKGAEQLVIPGKMPPETKQSLIAGSKLAFEWFDIYSPKLKQLAFFSLIKFVFVIFFHPVRSFNDFFVLQLSLIIYFCLSFIPVRLLAELLTG